MEKESKRKKKPAAVPGGGKEHKPNWREVYASVEDIQAFLSDNIFLRHNVITGPVECRIPSADPFSVTGDNVVPYSAEEIKARQRILVNDAESSDGPERDTFDAFDTIF